MIDIPEFKIVWTRIVARAAKDHMFMVRVTQDPATVFAEQGFIAPNESELNDYITRHFQVALAVLSSDERT